MGVAMILTIAAQTQNVAMCYKLVISGVKSFFGKKCHKKRILSVWFANYIMRCQKPQV